MPAQSTVAARCAALSSAITQIITDTSNFARRRRDSRHAINSVNADLLAIKMSLDIAQDDFSARNATFPVLLVQATSGILTCCSAATEELHKPVIKLSVTNMRNEAWHVFQQAGMEPVRRSLEAVRTAVDLVLDLVNLFNMWDNEMRPTFPQVNSSLGEQDPMAKHSLLRRIDVEREHVEDLTEGRLPDLYTSFDQLRACTVFLLEERTAAEEPPRSDSPLDTYDVPKNQPLREKTPPLSPWPTSTSNESSGIGAWIANVMSQIVVSPSTPPECLSIIDPRVRAKTNVKVRVEAKVKASIREESNPSRGTFYAESTTSGSRTQSLQWAKPVRITTCTRIDTSYVPAKMLKSRVEPLTYLAPPTITEYEHSGRVIRDKISKAKERRQRLTQNERVTLDWNIRNINRSIVPGRVERMCSEGADPNAGDLEFGTLLIRAAYELPVELLKIIIEYGADVSATTAAPYYSAVHAAVLGRRLENLKYLIAVGSPIDTTNTNGETPLHLAARTSGTYHIAKWLLENGADVDLETPEAGAPLHIAVASLDARERTQMVELLLAYGAEEISTEVPGGRGKGLSVLGLI